MTHKKPHGDEIFAIAILKRFRAGAFYSAPIYTVGSDEEAKKFASENRSILLGIGGGPFDEHGKDTAECAATLVAEHVNLDPLKFFRLLEEVREGDLKRVNQKTRLPEVMKVLYDHHTEEDVCGWALVAYDTLLKGILENRIPLVKRTEIVQEVAVELLEEYSSQKHILFRVWKEIQESVNNNKGTLTELSTVAELLSQTDSKLARDWLKFGLRAIFSRQIDFEEALKKIKESRHFTVPFVKKEGNSTMKWCGEFVGVFLRGQNLQFSRAFRSARGGSLDIAIVRNDDGHVQIFSCVEAKVPMEDCVRAIRFAEARKRNSVRTLESFGCGEKDPSVPQWFYFKKNGALMNGSRSHPNVEVTQLSDDEIMEAVKNAFHPDCTVMWAAQKTVCANSSQRLVNPVLR
ncbi:MAG TPA: hypothetical protein PLB51_02440 [Candidatus Paceibacterota bacterium]|nr:hypothetical protein [Candidatus Paceibacterota bacterium]